MSSFLRPVMRKNPSAPSKEPISPVRSQPSAVKASAVASGLLWYPVKVPMPRTRTSPSSPRLIAHPGIGVPTVPIRVAPGRLTEHGPIVSVRP